MRGRAVGSHCRTKPTEEVSVACADSVCRGPRARLSVAARVAGRGGPLRTSRPQLIASPQGRIAMRMRTLYARCTATPQCTAYQDVRLSPPANRMEAGGALSHRGLPSRGTLGQGLRRAGQSRAPPVGERYAQYPPTAHAAINISSSRTLLPRNAPNVFSILFQICFCRYV